MELIEEQIKRLQSIQASVRRESDFEQFWEEAKLRCQEKPLEVICQWIDYPISSWTVYQLEFNGLDNTTLRGWYILPCPHQKQNTQSFPCMVFYHGAGGSCSFPHTYAHWLAMGHAVLSYDFRLQAGHTGCLSGFSSGARNLHYYTLGITNPKECYLYHMITDAMRAVDVATQMPEVDLRKIWLNGGSQGGGVVLAIAALYASKIAFACADVPSACWIEKRIFDRNGGYGQIADFLRSHPDKIEEVSRCVSYFDNVNFAPWIQCPVLVSVGLKDPICPPENVYAACNRIQSPLTMEVYPFGEHDGGHSYHEDRKIKWVKNILSRLE